MDPIAQVERGMALFERGPLLVVASSFALAFFGLLVLHLREKDRHHKQLLELTVDVKAVLIRFVSVEEERRRRNGNRKRVEPLGPEPGSGYFEALPKKAGGGDDPKG